MIIFLELIGTIAFAVSGAVTGIQKLRIFRLKVWKRRDGNQFIAPEVANFIFNVAFLPAGLWIHEDGLEAVMLTEALESVGYHPAASFNDLCNNRACVIEPDLCRNAADVFEHGLKAFQKALKVFSVIQPEVSSIAVRKTKNQILPLFVVMAVFDKIGGAKIGLGFAGTMYKGNVILLFVKVQFPLFGFDIVCGQSVTAIVTLSLISETFVDF